MTTVYPFFLALFFLVPTNVAAATTPEVVHRITKGNNHTQGVMVDFFRGTPLLLHSIFYSPTLLLLLYHKASNSTARSRQQSPNSSIVGIVTDSLGAPLAGASLYLEGTKYSTSANSNGYFCLADVKPNSYALRIAAVGYEEAREAVVIAKHTTATLHVQLCSSPRHRSSAANDSLYGRLTGTVRDAKGHPVAGATVFVEGTRRGAYTKTNGGFTIVKLLPGTYSARVKSIGFIDAVTTATISAGSTERCTILLQQDPKSSRDTSFCCCLRRRMVDATAIGTLRTISAEEFLRAP